jgi:hypothetical protein
LINLSAYVNAGGMTTTSKQVPMNGWTATKTAVSMYFSMTTDLDFHNTNFTPIANSTSYPFKGRFNGNGHTISNININENSNYVGLFGYISKEPADGVNGATVGQEDSAAVEGIGLINANITGKQYVGGIVGYADKCEYIKDCYISNSTMGAYNGKGQAEYVGGIVGYAQSNSRVLYCYSNNTHITGHQYLGGIVGDNHTSIENCYSTSTITQNPQNQNNHQIGPITGTATSTSSVSNCYYLSGWSTNGYTTNNESNVACYGTAQNETQLKSTVQQLLTTSGTDFSLDVFNMNDGYPILNGEHIASVQLGGTEGITGVVNIPEGYNGPMPQEVIINDGGQLVNNTSNVINATIRNKMKVGAWNLFGSEVTNNIVGVLNSNYGLDNTTNEATTHIHDMVSAAFNYTTNNWNTGSGYLYYTDSLKEGDGIFVWPLTTGIGDNVNTTYNENYCIVEQRGQVFNENELSIALPENTGNPNGTDVQAKWAALSNPYSASVKVSSLINSNTNKIQGNAVYVYFPDNNNGWQLYDPAIMGDKLISRGEGFMIATSEPTSGAKTGITIKIGKNDLYDGTTTSTNNAKANDISVIRFNSQANNTTKTSYIVIKEKSKNGFDIDDAYSMFSNNENFVEPCFSIEGRNIIKNSISSLPYQTGINFHADKASTVSFSCEDIPEDITVSIIDTTTNTETVLDNGGVFNFIANKGNNEGKYIIKLGKKNVGIEDTVSVANVTLSLYPNPATDNTTLTINNLNSTAKVVINDIQGRTINTYNLSKEQTSLNINTENMTSGVYYVRVITNNQTNTEKLIVK